MQRLSAFFVSILLVGSGLTLSWASAEAAPAGRSLAPAQAAKKPPAKKKKKLLPPQRFITSSVVGPGVGQATIKWKKQKAWYKTKATGFRVETSLTQFSPFGKGLPRKGRHWRAFKAGAKTHKLVLSATQLAQAGAPLASASHLYFRVWSIDKHGKKKITWTDGKLRTAVVKGMASNGRGTPMTFASYNVRTAGLDVGSSHDWYAGRGQLAARAIAAKAPGIVALQEAVPTAYDGHNKDTDTQVLNLLNTVNRYSNTTYALVRSTYYQYLSKTQQGMRIMYDTSKYRLLSNCPEMTGVHAYNASCSVKLPLLHGDPASMTRWGAYAEFYDVASSKRFWVVSAHLDQRNTGSAAQQKAYNLLRQSQVATILAKVNSLNTAHEPVIFAGDLNDWQNNNSAYGDACHDYLVSHGFYDTAAAVSRINLQYPTVNHFAPLEVSSGGVGFRFDVIMTQGMQGASSFENVISGVGTNGPSDHNMVVAKFNLP